jgi:crossover junction endodeoxyribonuclease RusA
MSARIRFALPYPPSGNIYWRKTKSGKMYESEEAKEYKADVARRLADQRPLLGHIRMGCVLFTPQDAGGDLDNRLKILKDALRFHAYLDDKQVRNYIEPFGFDDSQPAYPRVELVLIGEGLGTIDQAREAEARHLMAKVKRRATMKKNEQLRAAGLMERPKKKRVQEKPGKVRFELAVPASYPPPKIE